MSGAWKGAARTSPAPVLGFSVGDGVSDATVRASGMRGRACTKGLVGGLAVWLPGTQFWFVPGLVFCPELGGLFVWTCWPARALKPLLATNVPPAVSKPIFKRS